MSAAPVGLAWRVGRQAVRALWGMLFVAPLAVGLVLGLAQAADAGAWRALVADPQTLPSWRLSVGTAAGSSLLALLIAMVITTHLHGSRWWPRVSSALAPMLALPHAAFAIGFALLLMPSGLAARALALATGWVDPPDWRSVNDAQGLALMAVLVLKELPFLLWNLVALLARPELSAQLQRHVLLAGTLGYRAPALWWRVLWPMLLPRLAWPLLAVLAYSLSVVDVALVVGPLSPPTLAALAWQSLLDGDPASQALGAVQVVVLAVTLVALVGVAWLVGALWRRAAMRVAVGGHRPVGGRRFDGSWPTRALALMIALVYALVALLLVLAASAGPWPFPALLPSSWDPLAALRAALWPTLGFSAGLAAAASVLALVLAIGWLEVTSPRVDAVLTPVLLAPLVVPPLLLLIGLYRGALWLRLDGSVWGLLWVHVIVVLPYAFIVLAPAWRSYDARFETTALALGRRRLAFWWRVKWPMQRAPIAAALSVGFAVALAQYLPTLFIGAGRFATVTTEAVTLSAGGQRQSAVVHALWQALLPMLGFALAAAVRRPLANRLPAAH